MKDMTISNIIEESSNRIPNREVFIFKEINKRYTYKEFNEKVNKVCNGLIKKGIKKRSHVGLWMDNIEQWYILFFAVNKIGGIVVPINTSFKSEEMDIILNNFDIDYLFMSEGYNKEYPNYINKIINNFVLPSNKYKRLKEIITIGFKCNNCSNYEDIENNEIKKIENNTNGSDICIILPTSGTTGMPKGVELTNNQLIKNGYDIGERYELSSNDNMLINVPMFHCFGITLSMLAALTHFSKMNVLSHFNSSKVLKIIEDEQITCINGVPTMYKAIMNDPNFINTNISSLKKGIMAGSNCLPDQMREVSTKMGMKVISVYGLSEATPGCTMSSISDSEYIRENTVGSALPDIECKIIDPKTNIECEIGQIGEFVVRGYNVMNGYYNNITETNKVIDKNGFLHTGDLAKKIDNDNYVITGRIKDTIIRGGENIYPKEVMSILNKCPGVIDSCVFGVKDVIYGEEIEACVISDGSVTEEEIRKFMKLNCASYKIPKYIKFVDDFIKNAAGKVLVYKMKEAY